MWTESLISTKTDSSPQTSSFFYQRHGVTNHKTWILMATVIEEVKYHKMILHGVYERNIAQKNRQICSSHGHDSSSSCVLRCDVMYLVRQLSIFHWNRPLPHPLFTMKTEATDSSEVLIDLYHITRL